MMKSLSLSAVVFLLFAGWCPSASANSLTCEQRCKAGIQASTSGKSGVLSCNCAFRGYKDPAKLNREYNSIRRQPPQQALLLNLLPLTGFGVGSFLQGDTTGGMIALLSSIGGLVALFQGSVMSSPGMLVFGLVGVVTAVVVGSKIFRVVVS